MLRNLFHKSKKVNNIVRHVRWKVPDKIDYLGQVVEKKEKEIVEC